MNCGRVQKIRFSDVENQLAKISPDLARAAAGLPDNPVLYRASYRYGDLIVNQGRFAPPCANGACSGCAELVADAAYNHIPLVTVLSRAVEVFIDPAYSGGWDCENPRHLPLRLLREGEIFGVFEVLDSIAGTPGLSPIWSVSAGARSIWIIAPIGDDRITQWLRKDKKIKWVDGPHWQLVQALHGADWNCEVLVFSGATVAALNRAPELYSLLLELGWKYSAQLRHRSSTEAAIRAKYQNSATKTPQGELQHYATVRHMLDIASGTAPAFSPAGKCAIEAGPFDQVQETLKICLAIAKKDYEPLILQPAHLIEAGDTGYYSFRYPSVPGPRPPRVANYAEIPDTIYDALEVFRGEPDVLLDFNRTTFFARSGQFASAENLPISELGNGSGHKVYVNSPFFVAGARIVRANSAPTASRVATP